VSKSLRPIIALAAFTASLSASQAAQDPVLDSSFLKPQTAPQAPSEARGKDLSRTVAPNAPKAMTKTEAIRLHQNERDESRDSAAKVLETVQSLTHLAQLTKNPLARNALILNRASAINLYVRKAAIQGDQLRLNQANTDLLKAAVKDSNEVLQSKPTPEQTQKAHFLLGLSYLYLDQMHVARAHFIKYLQLNPKAENAGWVALFVAEDLFDSGLHKEALSYYANFFGSMSRAQKELSNYKSAWCYINLKQPEKAEKIFASMIQHDSKQGLGKDSIRDLAFLLAHHADSADAIQLADQIFADTQKKVEFLNYVRSSLDSQSLAVMHTKVIERLLQLENDPEKRIILMLADVRVNRKLYASGDHAKRFFRLVQTLKSAQIRPDSPVFKKVSDQVFAETQFLMKAYIDTFARRTKTPEPFTRDELGQSLKSQFEFFNSYFPGAKTRPLIFNVWRDVCFDMKDWSCEHRLSEFIQLDRSFPTWLQDRAILDQLAALDEIAKGPPPASTEARARRVPILLNFAEKHEKSDQWLRITKLYTEILMDSNQYPKAISLLDKIFQRENSADALFRLQWARFRAGEHAAVLNDSRVPKVGKPEARMSELRREAALALAAKAKSTDSTAEFKAHIQNFLASNPDKAKALVARDEYFRYLFKKQMNRELTAELIALPPDLRAEKTWEDLVLRCWRTSMEEGRYSEAAQLLPVGRVNPQDNHDLRYLRLVSLIAAGETPSLADLRAQNADKRDYLLGLLALVKPQVVIDYCRSQNNLSATERDFALLALRIHEGQWLLPRSDLAVRLLGSTYKFAATGPQPYIPIELRIRRLSFPKPNLDGKILEKAIQSLVSETQKIRQTVSAEIKKLPAEVQIRAVESAADLENRVANLILGSPIPKALTPEQVIQYKNGLQNLAKEFQDQSTEFMKLSASIQAVAHKLKLQRDSRLIPRPAMQDWTWPPAFLDDTVFIGIRNIARFGNILGALVLLDFFRADHLSADTDYFWIRTGLLLSSPHKDTLRIYLLEELQKNKQELIIETWKKLAGQYYGHQTSSPAIPPAGQEQTR